MGVILGKFRKKKSTLEILENVEREIKSIEEFRKDTEQAQKRIVGRFVVISVGAYLITAFIFYFHFFPADFYDQLFYIIPLIFAPVIIITVKRGLTWYYKQKISRKQSKLFTLREEKKKLLDQVKETETYKVAKTILDKYAPESQVVTRRSMGVLVNDNGKTPMKLETPALHDTVLRQRALPAPLPAQMSSTFITPYRPLVQHSAQLQIQAVSNLPPARIIETPTPLPRGILPRDRSVFDKIVDYLVGDGPSNRFALICKNCYSHNGMAHKDEFEYVSFRCCYCFAMNLARKKRPDGPKLEFDAKLLSAQAHSEASESEKNSPSESDAESEFIEEITEIEATLPPEQPMEVDEPELTMTAVKQIVDVSVPTAESFSEPIESKEPPPIDLKD